MSFGVYWELMQAMVGLCGLEVWKKFVHSWDLKKDGYDNLIGPLGSLVHSFVPEFYLA